MTSARDPGPSPPARVGHSQEIARPKFDHGTRGLRRAATLALAAMVALSAYGSFVPADVRCGLPGAVGCPGGVLGAALPASGAGVQWFDVIMYDWGFWIVDTSSGVNETSAWNVFEGWTVHVNATSEPPTVAIGGTAYHGLGVELNATGQQLLSVAAPVGKWVSASFVAPTAEYHHQHLWCTIECGPGHSGQQAWVLNIVPPSILPLATAKANVSSGAAPFAVGFTGNATLGTPPYNYSWQFGDGTPAGYGPNPSHVYTLGGLYYATVTVTDAKGYTGQASATVTVLSGAPLTAAIGCGNPTGVAPAVVTCNVTTHGGVPPYEYAWSFGDGSTANASNSTPHLYTTAGLYATLVNVVDSAGARTSVVTSFVLRPANGTLSVTLNVSAPNGSAPFVAAVSATATGGAGPYAFLWVWGDGALGTGANATHTYNLTGSYAVRVYAKDPAGAVGVATTSFTVTAAATGGGGGSDDGGGIDLNPAAAPAAASPSALTAPTLSIDVTPSTGPAPLAVEGCVSLVGGTGLNTTASWTFGDGTTATGLVVTHTYSTEGRYTVVVGATDSGGARASASTVVVVGGPVVRLFENSTLGDAPFSVLAAASVTGGTGTYGALGWAWGDGSNATGNIANHTYAPGAVGNFTLQATVADSAGVVGSGSAVVEAFAPPTASVTVGLPTSAGLPASVVLTVTVHGGTGHYATQALWSFGDGTSGRAPATTAHAFTKFGHYLVTVVTNDSYGRSANATAWVNLSFNLSIPKGTAPVWSLTGVPDPSSASLALLGLVGLTGLLFLYRRKGGGRRGPASRAPISSTHRTAPDPRRSG
jgi:PKD repeat protein